MDLGQGDTVDGHGAEGVEEDLEGAEEGLSEDGVEDKGLEGSREISVEAIDAKRLVMGEMVGLAVISTGSSSKSKLNIPGKRRCRECQWADWRRLRSSDWRGGS